MYDYRIHSTVIEIQLYAIDLEYWVYLRQELCSLI